MRVAFIFDKQRPDTTGLYFQRAAQQLGLTADHWWLREASRLPEGYDLYLRIDHGDDYDRPLPAHCRPAAFYAIDTHLAHSWKKIRRMAAQFDAVCCCHQVAARLLDAAWVPVGCDAEWHRPLPLPPRWDVAFVGTQGGVPRKFLLQALRERYPASFIGAAGHERISEIYSQAKIGFNYSIADDVNMRAFEIMACGSLLLTNAIRYDDYTRLGLRPGEHFVAYASAREIPRLVDHYLAHPAEGAAIARRGHDAVRREHTYQQRFQQLWTHVGTRVKLPSLTPDRKDRDACAS